MVDTCIVLQERVGTFTALIRSISVKYPAILLRTVEVPWQITGNCMFPQHKGWVIIRSTTASFHILPSAPFTFSIEFYSTLLYAVEVDVNGLKWRHYCSTHV
jgi:hypothetical protein